MSSKIFSPRRLGPGYDGQISSLRTCSPLFPSLCGRLDIVLRAYFHICHPCADGRGRPRAYLANQKPNSAGQGAYTALITITSHLGSQRTAHLSRTTLALAFYSKKGAKNSQKKKMQILSPFFSFSLFFLATELGGFAVHLVLLRGTSRATPPVGGVGRSGWGKGKKTWGSPTR